MILMYHKVAPDTPTMWWVSVDTFYQQMVALKSKEVVNLDNYDPQNPEQAVITFDGIYKNVLQFAAPILKEFGYPFELFLTSDYVGGDNAFDSVEPLTQFTSVEDLLALKSHGGRLQWHTRSHPRMDDVKNHDQAERELTVPDHIKKLDERGFNWFAYPHGDLSEPLKEMVKRKFVGAVSCIQGNNTDRFQLNRLTVTEETDLRSSKIGVVIPSYNYGHFLYEAYDSVMCQTFKPDKILVIDDHSSDITAEIGQALERQNPRVKFIRNEKNLGIVGTFNKAVQELDTEYICFLGADNRFGARYLEEGYSLMASGADIAYSNFALFGDRAKLVYDQFLEEWRGGEVEKSTYVIDFPDYDEIAVTHLREGRNFINGSSVFRKSFFDKVGGYREVKNEPEDYGLFFSMVKAGARPAKMPTAYLEYRQHSSDQANIRLGAYNTMLFYKGQLDEAKGELSNMYGKIATLSEENEKYRNQLHQIYEVISPLQLVRIWLARMKKRVKIRLRAFTD